MGDPMDMIFGEFSETYVRLLKNCMNLTELCMSFLDWS